MKFRVLIGVLLVIVLSTSGAARPLMTPKQFVVTWNGQVLPLDYAEVHVNAQMDSLFFGTHAEQYGIVAGDEVSVTYGGVDVFTGHVDAIYPYTYRDLSFQWVAASAANILPGAVFVRTDTTTQGNWRGPWHSVYGAEGYVLADDATSLPAYARVAFVGNLSWIWEASTPDVRALLRPTTQDRMAATWYGDSYDIDIHLLDPYSHQVALYLVDWDSRDRIERIDVLDATTGAVLDTRVASDFVGGEYLVWMLSGHVRIRVTLTAGVNAVISGVLFDRGKA